MEKRKISSLMDVKKLSREACIHAAQNDRLPLRVVVQVLFYEQLRAAGAQATGVPAANGGGAARCLARLAEDDNDWKPDRALQEPPTPGSLKKQLGSLKLTQQGDDDSGRRLVARSSSAIQTSRLSLSSRSRRIFDRLWVGGGKPPGEVLVGKESDTSGSSQSPRSSAKPLESNKSSSSSSRNRRYSLS
jgi:hypothetical protein